MARQLNSGLSARGPRRYTPRTKSITVPAGDLESRLAWVAEAEQQDDRSARATAIYEHEKTAGFEVPEAELSSRLTAAVYGQQPPVQENLESPGASGQQPDEADTTDAEGVVKPMSGTDLDEQLEATEPEPETIPDGVTTIDALIDWVKAGDTSSRAQIVLDQENTKPEDKRRKGLISKLTDIILED